jgi:hypothetical protein
MIRLLVSVAGADFSHYPGAEAHFDDVTDARYVESGQAVYVVKEDKPSGNSAGNTVKRATRKPV